MKTIRLELEMLLVESFDVVAADASVPDAVQGHSITAQRPCTANGGWTCEFSCKC